MNSLSVDKECSPVMSVLAQILGHYVFRAGPFLPELVTHAFSHVDFVVPRYLVRFTLYDRCPGSDRVPEHIYCLSFTCLLSSSSQIHFSLSTSITMSISFVHTFPAGLFPVRFMCAITPISPLQVSPPSPLTVLPLCSLFMLLFLPMYVR